MSACLVYTTFVYTLEVLKGNEIIPIIVNLSEIKFQSKPQNYLYIQKLTYNEVYIYRNCLITTKVHPNVSSASKHLIQPQYLRLIRIVQTCAAKMTSLYLMLKKFCLYFVEDIWYQKFFFFFISYNAFAFPSRWHCSKF